MFNDPYAKLCCTSIFASEFDRVIYVDLDTTFTAYFMAGLLSTSNVDIYLPSEGRFTPMIKDVIARIPSSSLVIFDSVNSFYNLFKAQKRIGNLNHLLSIFLMLLVRQGVDSGVPVLATSMLRYRKEGGWVQSPASRRLLQHKSAVKLSVERQDSDLVLKVVEHESMPPGTEVVYSNSMITV